MASRARARARIYSAFRIPHFYRSVRHGPPEKGSAAASGATARPRSRDGPTPADPGRALPRRRQTEGQGRADHRRRQRHRARRRHRLRQGRRRPYHRLSERTSGRRGDPPPGRVRGAALPAHRRRRRRRGLLPSRGAGGDHRLRAARRAGQQRRRTAPPGQHRKDHRRAARAHLPHQYFFDVLYGPGCPAASQGRQRDHQHHVGDGLPRQRAAPRLLRDQGGRLSPSPARFRRRWPRRGSASTPSPPARSGRR